MLRSSALVLDHNLMMKLLDMSKVHEKQIEKKEKTLQNAIAMLTTKLRELEEDELKLRLLFNFEQDTADLGDDIILEPEQPQIVDIPSLLNQTLMLETNPYRVKPEMEEEEEEEDDEDEDDIPRKHQEQQNIRRITGSQRFGGVSDVLQKLEQQQAKLMKEIKDEPVSEDDDNSLIVNISDESNSEMSLFSSDDNSSSEDDTEVDLSRKKVLADEVDKFFKIISSSEASDDEDEEDNREEINEDDFNKEISKLLDDFN